MADKLDEIAQPIAESTDFFDRKQRIAQALRDVQMETADFLYSQSPCGFLGHTMATWTSKGPESKEGYCERCLEVERVHRNNIERDVMLQKLRAAVLDWNSCDGTMEEIDSKVEDMLSAARAIPKD